MDRRQRDERDQHFVAEPGISNPAVACPRNSEQVDDYRAQLDTRPRAREQQLEVIPSRAKVDREEQKRHLNNPLIQYETSSATEDRRLRDLQEELQTKDQQLRDLRAELARKDQEVKSIRRRLEKTAQTKDQELRDRTHGFQAELAQKDQEADNIRQKWKGTARELGKFQTRGKVIDQVADSDLIHEATKIQYNVRNFTYQHFGDDLNTGKSVQGSLQYLRKNLEISPDFFDACIQSSVKRPILVGALLWAFLMNDIFEKFWWAGGRVHQGIGNLMDELKKLLKSEFLADKAEATGRYQMWKANTSALLVDALEHDGERDDGGLQDNMRNLCAQLAPLTKSEPERIEAEVVKIIQKALDLDQLLSKQVAGISWVAAGYKGRVFDEESMELQQGEKRTVDGQKVQLVLAPALIKRGRSTGEDYGRTRVLLRTTVTCELISSAQSHHHSRH